MTKKSIPAKGKTLQIWMSEVELAQVREAAKQAEMTMSHYGRKIMAAAVLQQRKPREPEALTAVKNFERLFCEAMELSLAGKLTVPRFRGLMERRSS